MDSSSKRVLLTVIICAAIWIVWYTVSPPPPPPPKLPEKSPPASVTTSAKAGQQDELAQSATSQPSENVEPTAAQKVAQKKAGPIARDMEGVHTTLKTKGAIATFTTTGGAIRHWVLTEERYKEHWKGKLRQVDLVKTPEDKGPWSMVMTFPKSDFEVPERAEYTLIEKQEDQVRFQWESEKVRVSKHYVLDSKRTVVWLTLKVRNITSAALNGRLEVNLYNQQDSTQGEASFTNPYPKIATVLCHINGELHRRSSGAIDGSQSGCSAAGCGMGEGPVSQLGELQWIGMDDRYFLMALIPQDKVEQRRCDLSLLENKVIKGSLLYPEISIKPGEVMTRSFAIFIGAKDLYRMDAMTGPSGAEIELGDAIEFGWFAVICRPMVWLLKNFYSIFGNWGVAIILLTLVVKLITLYWTQKSMRSMKEMQRLKPKIDILKVKFKDDKQRFNQEMMALYKVHKVNPLGGCLPMLIQMPVWFALYRTLGNSVELYRSNFFGWITDLTAPDPYYVLPILMGAAMYGQQAITPQPMEGAQAKMMKYFMPGMFTVMMLALPSGLTLYIFINTLLTMLHQFYMNKKDPLPPAAPSATITPEPQGGQAGHNTSRSRKRKKKKNRT